MKKYRQVEVTEAEMEDLVRQAPDLIESGLVYIDHQAFTDRGPLDVLMVDSGRSLIVAELKVVEDDGMLLQGMDYYDYINSNLDGFAAAYKQHKVDTKQPPRLFLIAPSFSVTLLNRIKWVDIPISLFGFQCIQFEDPKGEITPVYKEITFPGKPARVEAYALEDRFNYMTDVKVRSLAQSFVSELQDLEKEKVLVEATKYAISIKYIGRVLSYIEPRRKHFLISTYDLEGKWFSTQVNSTADLETAKQGVKTFFEKLKQT